jgi:predicted DNA-binding transcriptional regulator AlpA
MWRFNAGPRRDLVGRRKERKMSSEANELLLPDEAAHLLRLAKSSLAKMRCLGGGPRFIKLGRSVRYLRSDCNEWRDERRVRNTIEGESVPRRLAGETRR